MGSPISSAPEGKAAPHEVVRSQSRRRARWIVPHSPEAVVGHLQSELGLNRLVASVLAERGFTDPDATREFLSPQLTSLLDPLAMRDMELAVDRLMQAIVRKEPILLYGDYDVDGTCSIVVLKKAIEILGGAVTFHVPDRVKEGYGMRSDVIDRAAMQGTRLIVSVDTGIRAGAVVRHANGLNIDVIVTDHHLPEADLPPALAVLNPNRPDCEYPNKNLCGAGVTLKLVQALLERSALPADRKAALLESFLKPVAIATVADIVPLTGENRVIVQRGLSGLRQVRNIGLRALLTVAGFDEGECPSAHQVAFRLAPRINAAGRMASAQDVVELFLTDNTDRAKQLAAQLDAFNRERQKVETEIVEQIVADCEATAFDRERSALVFSGSGWHPGVLGIVASRLVERFWRPVFVLSDVSGEAQGLSGTLSGSGRSIPAFHLLDALESMPELFSKFGGHRQAAGLTLSTAALEDFRERFHGFAASKLCEDDLCPQYTADAFANFIELSDAAVEQVMQLGPFGFGNTSPLFYTANVEVAGPPRVIREGKHYSVPLRENGRVLWCKAWNFGDRMAELTPGSKIDILFQIEDDAHSRKRGYGWWCVTLKDIRFAQEAVQNDR